MADNTPLWQQWLTEASAITGVPVADVDVQTVLKLTKDVAHQVDRPMAPVTVFMLGLALGRDHDVDQAALCQALSAAAKNFETPHN